MDKISRRRFTDDFKSQAVALGLSLGPAAASRKLGMSVKTMARWLAAARDGRAVISPKRRGATDLEAEVSRLLAENATLKMERDILKNRLREEPRPTGKKHPELDCGAPGQWPTAFWRHDPVKKPGPREAADPMLVA